MYIYFLYIAVSNRPTETDDVIN